MKLQERKLQHIHIKKEQKLLESYGIRHLFIFGSYAKNTERVDYRVGMLSSDVLELYMLDGKLGFGIVQILEMIGIIAGKNLWNNKDKLLPF